MKKIFLLILVSGIMYGCATAKGIPLNAGADKIEIGKRDPDSNMMSIGPIEVIHGSGCGGFGAKGTYEGAYNMLRNKALSMGAAYVQLITITEPHSEYGCYDNKFVIRGLAFK